MKRILIVDDVVENRYLLEATMRAYGYEVASANNGEEALAIARRHPPDLVISDILMPVMDGFALCRQWRAEEPLCGIPLMFYTATYTDAQDEQLAMDLGADRFVIKPQEPQVMIEIVRDIFARRVNQPTVAVASPSPAADSTILRVYNKKLVHKLEKKVAELEAVREALEEEIRQRRKVEKALRRSEERWRLIYETEPECVKVVSSGGCLMDMNPAGLAMIGANSLEVAIRTPLLDLVAPEHREAFRALHNKVISGQSGRLVYEIIGLKGTRRWLETHAAPLRSDGAVFLLAISHDITERRRAEAALVESEQRFRDLFENSRDAIFVEDAAGNVRDVNPAACRLHGLTREELLNRNVRDLVPEELRKGIDAEFSRLFCGELTQAEGLSLCADGTAVPVELSVSRISYNGQPSLLLHVRDITERKRANDKLRAGRKRLQVLSRQLLSAQESERRHIARELHDQIGQSLTAIKLNLKALEPAAHESSAQSILHETIAIVDQTLDQARNLSLDLRPSMLDDLGLVAALRWYLDRQAKRAGFAVHFSAESSDSGVSKEIETTCFRVAQEIVTNIARHAQAQNVRVELNRLESELELLVRDDGVGFDTTATQGVSQGLLGMQERVLIVGGRLEIKSAPTRGTKVRVRFPLTPGEPGSESGLWKA